MMQRRLWIVGGLGLAGWLAACAGDLNPQPLPPYESSGRNPGDDSAAAGGGGASPPSPLTNDAGGTASGDGGDAGSGDAGPQDGGVTPDGGDAGDAG